MRKPYGACVDCSRPMWISGSRCYECRPRLTLVCQACGLAFLSTTEAKACSRQCRKNLRDGLRCADCQKPMALTKGSSPQGEARCRACRQIDPRRSQLHPCADCGTTCWGERCHPCQSQRQVIRSADDHRTVRRQREKAAPGIKRGERDALLAKWKRQGRTCAYCSSPATTIDHVLPLVRGGTNYEGNLAPACKPCNSSKGGLTVIEWRTGKRLPRMTKALGWTGKAKPIKAIRGEQVVLFNVCPECGSACLNKYCNNTCGTRYVARANYRRKVGIPLDAPLYGSDAPQWRRTWAA